MAIFVERTDEAKLTEAVTRALGADPGKANDAAEVATHVAAAKAAAKAKPTFYWGRIALALAVAGVLLAVGIVLALVADSWAADQALKAATTPGYEAPDSQLPAVATSIIALASAWSGGLVGIVLAES